MNITKEWLAKHRIKSGREYPYDAPDGWVHGKQAPPEIDSAHAAARGILADLSDRLGIKKVLYEIDEDIRIDIINSISEIIRQATTTQTDENNMTENDLKPLLTDDFLETLRLAVKVRGWDQDAVETISFANWLFELAGKVKPDTEPFYNPELPEMPE